MGRRRAAVHAAAGLGVDRRELNLLFCARHVMIVAFQILSYFGRSRGVSWWEPVTDFALVLPYSFVCHRVALRQGHMPGWVPIIDALILVVWVGLEPQAAPSMTLLLIATLTIAGHSVEARWLWSAFGVSGVGLIVVGFVAGGDLATVDIVRFLVIGAGVLTTVTVVRTSRLDVHRRLIHSAEHDQLTGLASRALLHECIDRAPVDRDLAVLLADLDNFKEVNDALGHHVGDELLIAVSRRIVAAVPERATVGRLGGDEFAVSLPDCDLDEAVAIVGRITDTLRNAFVVDGLTIEVAASVGIAARAGVADGDEPAPAEVLLRNADVAMYQAKEAGRPHRVYDPSDDHSSVRRVTLMGELRSAIARDEFEVWYQPALDVASGRLTSMEALVRWRHPRHGLLFPGEFIELAEVSGAIDELTQWVVERAVHDSLRLAAAGRPVAVACNLSVRNLHDRALLDWLTSFAAASGVPRNGLFLELTESQIMEDPAGASMVLTQLAELGIGSAVDDFGTGYSSLSMLLHVRASVLKIDRSFVADLLRSPQAEVLVRSMIDLGHNLGMMVVGEGVEDQATLDRLCELGCDVLQGYHIARPMPFDHLTGFLGVDVGESATLEAARLSSDHGVALT